MLAVVRALKKNPDANGRVEGREVHLSDAVDLSVAIALPGNLLVAPAMFGADAMDVTELRAARQDLATRAKINKLTVTEMTGGTFTVSNLGLTRVEHFTPIINAPEVAILGVSRGGVEPVHIDGEFQPRVMLPLSLSYDHRLIDGADAARFLRWLAEALENPFLALPGRVIPT